jgi:thiamine biosynthesis protein ThiS
MEMNPNATIMLNGQSHGIELPMTVGGLLCSLGMEGKPVVVELDEVAVFPRDFPRTPVPDGARVEIVVLAAGG